MNIAIIAVGKLRDSYWKEAIDEFSKRIQPMASLAIFEAKETTTKDVGKNKEQEALAIKQYFSKEDYVIVLDIKGKMLSSEEFSAFLDKQVTYHSKRLVFVIGGSDGLHNSIKENADMVLSFSNMTFPHGLMRVILVEQLYRALSILYNKNYHK